MFPYIAGSLAAGFILGTLFGKYVVSEASAIKTHISNEIKDLERRLKAKL